MWVNLNTEYNNIGPGFLLEKLLGPDVFQNQEIFDFIKITMSRMS